MPKLLLLPGDGIGPEVIAEVRKVAAWMTTAAGLDLGGREELLAALTELAGDRRSPAIVLVTHHVEEIPVGFTHVLLMRGGEVVAAGPLGEVLTAENLSATYAMPVELTPENGRYTARRAQQG